uniref:ARF7EP_C domain-containing protein n=1 Tax=Angiostrongylus cantonensis TaxID=6313 RepID=A0A0K0DKC5_ANGCA
MSSTNDALSVLVGLTNSRSSSSIDDSSPEKCVTYLLGLLGLIDRQRQMQRELGRLQFINPGGLMVQPINNRRSRRKVNEDRDTIQEKRQVFHDKRGKLIIPGEECITICDCLLAECHGCHWPCEHCGSRLCGTMCQQNRKKFVSQVKQLGVTPETVTNNPFAPKKS